jgi:hypothetical protein
MKNIVQSVAIEPLRHWRRKKHPAPVISYSKSLVCLLRIRRFTEMERASCMSRGGPEAYGAESEVAIACVSHKDAKTTNIENPRNSGTDISSISDNHCIGTPAKDRRVIPINATITRSRNVRTIAFDVTASRSNSRECAAGSQVLRGVARQTPIFLGSRSIICVSSQIGVAFGVCCSWD